MMPQRHQGRILILVLLLATALAGLPLRGADEVPASAPPKPAPTAETPASLDKKIADLDAAQLTDLDKATAREYYQQARDEVELLTIWAAQRHDFEVRKETAASRLAEMKQLETEANNMAAAVSPPRTKNLTELEKRLAEEQAELDRVNVLVKQLDAEPQRRAERRLEIPKNIATLGEQIKEIEQHLGDAVDPLEIAAVTQARRTLLETRLLARRAQYDALEAELAAYDAEKDLPERQRNYNRNLQPQLSHSVEVLTKMVNERRQMDVARRHSEVERQKRQAPEVLKPQASRNLALSEEARELTENLAKLESEISQLKQEFSEWQERVKRTKRRVEKGSRESAVMSLRTDRSSASERLTQLRREFKQRLQEVQKIQFLLVDRQDQSDQFADIDAQVGQLRKKYGFDKAPEEEQALINAARHLLTTHKDLLVDLTIRTNRYFNLLVECNDVAQDFISELRTYMAYLDERILWMRSAEPISGNTLVAAGRALSDLRRGEHWRELGSELWNDTLQHPLQTIVFVVSMVLLFGYRQPMRRKVGELGDSAARGNCVHYLPTFKAVTLTLLISGTWALLLAYLGWRLSEAALAPRSQLSLFWGSALLGGATIYFPLEAMRQICRRKGLGECHFNWSPRVLALLRMHLRWFVLVATMLMMVCYGMQAHRNDSWNTSLGRLSYVVLMVLTTTVAQRLARPQGGVFQEYLAYHGEGWFGRLKFLWYPSLVLAPAATAILAAIGYYYTARQLSVRLYYSAIVVSLAMFVGALLYRRLLISRRNLAIRQSRERQQRLQEQTVAEDAGRALPLMDTSMDLAAMNLQTRRLIHATLVLASFVCIWFIWSDMLPALAVFENITLYRTDMIAGVVQSVTMADLGIAIIALVMTWIAARNLPGVIEIALLQRLPLESSVRYAITTLARYVIAIVGLIIISSTLGFSWRRAQWLVAALGVGLGFGLQEIFANFVSGLILLFERPIRVGDVITLGEVSGVVKRIRIRATTVRDSDGKELIVPNKDLITGRLLNWTLSDTENRIVITVGIAYGSNVKRAREIMLEIVDEHPCVSKQPAATVTFEGFDASSLKLVLRAFLPMLDARVDVIHDLHLGIHDRFLKEGIEMAFPQLDVHVRDFAPVVLNEGQPQPRERVIRAG